MQFDMQKLDSARAYKIIGTCVTPRPIAWVSTRSEEGCVNLAPFSFFNALGHTPPTVALGFTAHPEGRLKDTARNIRETGEFVVNLVNEANAEAMNRTSVDAPADVDEAALAHIPMAAGTAVGAPRVEAAPVSFECRMLHWLETGTYQIAVVGEILCAHIHDEFLIDPDRILIDIDAMALVSRLHGANWYGRQTDRFEMRRPVWNDGMAATGKK